jgi:hypothetical protein
MTQMTQWPPAGGRRRHGRHGRHGLQHAAKGEGVGPSAKGQQKRSVHEQFFFSQNFYFLL